MEDINHREIEKLLGIQSRSTKWITTSSLKSTFFILPDPTQHNNHLQFPQTLQIPGKRPWFSQDLSFFHHDCPNSHYSFLKRGICFLDKNCVLGFGIWVYLCKLVTITEPLPHSKHKRMKKNLKTVSRNCIWKPRKNRVQKKLIKIEDILVLF